MSRYAWALTAALTSLWAALVLDWLTRLIERVRRQHREDE